MAVNVYEDFDTESFIINNIKLRVNPTDVTLFADNAVQSETYLRSKAVFSFRSKYAREKVILTLPISISVTDATNDENAIYSREDGLRLLSQLSNYPFCFIKSSRIKSYVAPLGGVSSTDFLLFGVQQLTIVQDMSMPDVLFLEIHLVFNNFAPLLRDFKFKDFTNLTEYPSQSTMFNQAFAELEGNKKAVDNLLSQLKNLLNDSQTSGSAYIDGSLPYGTTVILAPKISEDEENALVENAVDYSSLLNETKTFEVTASDGTASYNADFLSEVASEEPKKDVTQKKKFRVAWSAPSDLSFGGVAALQRIKITKYNKLARQYVSAHKHPVLQYMGRQPSTVELVYKVNSSEVYKENISSIIAAYSHLFNILDFNNLTYPEATAYNTLKIRSIAAQAIGLTSVVPNQKHIGASSNEQGIETFSVSLVESDIEDFMKISKPILGREVAGTSSGNIYKEAVVLSYLEKVSHNTGVVTSKMFSTKFLERYNSDYKDIYEVLFREMANTYEAILSEFAGGAVGGKEATKGTGYNQVGYINNNFKNLVNNYTDNVALTRDLKTVSSVLVARIKYRNAIKNLNANERAALAEKTKNSPINIEFEGQGTKTIIPADNYKQAGVADNSIAAMFLQIEKLADLGDSAAKSSFETHKADTSNINDARVTSYSGSNFKEFNLSYLKAEGGGADPMYFVEPYYHMSSNDLLASYKLVNDNFKASIDDVLANSDSIVDANSQASYNFASPILTPKVIDEHAYSKEESTGYHVDAMGRQSEGTDDFLGTAGGNYGVISGSGSGAEFVDWYAKTGLSAVQLKAKQAIIDGVKKDSRIEAKDKANWTVFLIQLAGRESRLGEAKFSGTGAKGLFQIVGGTAKGLGYTDDQVLNDFGKATEAAIKYLVQIKAKCIKNSWTNWVHFYFLYNLGEGGGTDFLKSYYNNSGLNSARVTQINQQGNEAVNSSRIPNTAQLAKAYFNLVVNHFAPMNKHMDTSGNAPVEKQKVEKHVGVKTEATSPTTYSRDDIKKNFIKVSYVDKPNEVVLPHSFYVDYNGKQYKIMIKDINCPYPDIPNRTMVMKNYNNRTVVYTRKAQPFGTDALNKMKELTKGGFYIEKSALVSGGVGNTYAYNLNFQDIGKLMVEMGLSFAVNKTQYANIKSNFYLGRSKQESPATYDAKYTALAKKYADGDKSVRFEDFASRGVFKDTGEDFLTAERKITSAGQKKVVDVRPSSTVNTYLPFANETGRVTGVYGEWRQGSGRHHFGIDSVPTSGASTQHAAADGIVVQKGYAGAAGNRIRIWHPKIGYSTQYFHLKDYSVNEGDRVAAGQVIGYMGNTGISKGAHSHYQVGFGNSATGNLINPWKTTKLSLIPAYTGTTPAGLQEYAAKFLSNGYYLSGANKDLRSTGKVYKGDELKSGSFDNTLYQTDPNPDNRSMTERAVSTLKNATGMSKSRGIPKEYSVYNEEEIVNRQISNMLFPYAQGLNTSFPVMKAYITVGTDNEDMVLNDQVRLTYYFEVDGLAGVHLNCNNDDNPVDTMILTVANPSFTATDNYAVTGKYLTTDMTSLYGPDEVEWVADRIKIKSGTKLHIRAGYGNNPNDLTTMFNGVVTQVSGEKSATLKLVCEGYGRELVATQINPTKPEAAGGEWYNSSTSLIYSKCLLQDNIVHFGAKTSFLNTALAWLTPFGEGIQEDDVSDPEAKRLVTRFGANPFGTVGIHFTGGNLKQRLFTNIYTAEIDVLQPEFASKMSNYFMNLLSTTEKSGYFYIFEGQTPWEAMKEMEYRHPGTKAKPLFFEDRMTMFFGLKEQMYIARDLDSAFMNSVASQTSDTTTVDYLKQRNKRFDLVTRFHIATSANNIISNGLSLDSTFSTGVDVMYFEDDDERIEQKPDSLESFRMSLDDDLNYWEYRYKTVSLPGTHGKYSSFMYGTTELRKQAEQMYGGKITLIGNPQIKAGDYLFLDDDTKKMTGIIKVRECMHHFTEDGFTTEITPGLYIEASSFYYTTLFTRLGLTAQAAIALSNFSIESTALSNRDFNVFYNTFIDSTNNSMLTNITNTASAIIYNSGANPLAAAALGSISMYTTLRTLHNLGLNSANTQAAYAYGEKAYKLAATQSAKGYKSLTQTMSLFKNTQKGQKAINTFNNLRSTSMIIKGLANTAKTAYWSAGRMLLVMGKIRRASAVLLQVGSKHPIGFLITVIGTFVYKYIEGLIQESMLTRQPLLLYPINYFGRPYVAGISGFTVNSWLESKKSNLDRNLGYASKLAQEKRILYPDSAISSITGYFSSTTSYNTSLVANLRTVETRENDTKTLGKK